jgi:acetyltransferase
MTVKEDMKFFMEPTSVALIGVPRRTGKLSLNILENLLEYGFSGKVYPVNPNADQILGIQSYPSLKEVPGPIDLALIATPRPSVLQIVKECADKGVRAVVVVTQGFSDFDEKGRALEAEMVRILHKAGARLLGPNTLGIANVFARVNTSFSRPEVTRVPVGVITQTGSFFTGTQKFLLSGKSIDLGNSCDIDFSDCLEYFEDDPETEVIALYIEGIQDGRRFMEVSGRVSRKKPVIALKSGRTASGTEAAKSHTAQMAGRDEVYEAVFRQSGIIRVADIEELGDLAKAFSQLPLMRGEGLGIVTMSGSGGVLAADACQDYGLRMAELLPETKAKIKDMSLPWVNINNPIDIWPAIFSQTQADLSVRFIEVSKIVLEVVAKDPTVDGILFIAGVYNKKDEIDPTEIVLHIADQFPEKPIVCFLHGRNAPFMTDRLQETGKTLVFPSFERCVRALGRLWQYAEYLKRINS